MSSSRRDYSSLCASPGQKLIEDDIKEKGLTRVVVAACSPHLQERPSAGPAPTPA